MSNTNATVAQRSNRIQRPAVTLIQTSIRLSRGAREALNFVRHTLNANRSKGEPAWSLGEVIELSILDAYVPWYALRQVIRRTPHMRAPSDAERKLKREKRIEKRNRERVEAARAQAAAVAAGVQQPAA